MDKFLVRKMRKLTPPLARLIVASIVISVISEEGVYILLLIIGQVAKAYLMSQGAGIVAGFLKRVDQSSVPVKKKKNRRRHSRRRRNDYFLR